ncbi:F-box and associated interaction domains-containing protein [Thalictrum thalictroides]|uniref:F-box and associated interaction domains-containing protein n=1 Tax=Thalictrum thalictroides TaxID=46969 RepID=A0A7J6VZZ1_THATH|nr:F-box and associated interaction domains-containing protein [Thalictrum thalictroides]
MKEECCELPDDIIKLNILTRLDPVSLCRLKCVCKSWCSLIQDKNFIDYNFDFRRKTTVQIMGRFCSVYGFYSIDQDGICTDIGPHASFAWTTLGDPWVPCCNGLFCFLRRSIGGYINLHVCNPIYKKEIITLPKPDFLEKPYFRYKLGFGFDILSKRYKIIGCCHEKSYPLDQIEVLTLGVNESWRILKGKTIDASRLMDKIIYVNGSLYWYSRYMNNDLHVPRKITSFNLGDESFGEIDVPSNTSLSINLHEIDGNLCLIEHNGKTVNLWILTTSTTGDRHISWINLRINLPIELEFEADIIPIRRGQVLIQSIKDDCYYLCHFDEDGHVLKTIELIGILGTMYVFGKFDDSLVTLRNVM